MSLLSIEDLNMPVRALISGSKGRYRCSVCLDCQTYQDSRLQAVESHIRSVHPLTTRAWIYRDQPGHRERLPEDAQVVAHAPDEASPEDEFLSTLSHKKLMSWHMSSIKCDSHEDAVKKIKIMSVLPKQHFIKCFFPCVVDGSMSIGVEKYKNTFSYPTKGHTENAIRHIIKNSMELELGGIVGNLKSVHLVDVDYLPKYTSMPVEFKGYDDFQTSINIQSHQICECVDRIVGDGINDEDYKVFRERLLYSKTIVDLHSMLYSPYLTPERQQPVFFCSCRILSHYTKMDRKDFNTIVENFRTEWSNIATSNLQNQMSWQEILKNSKHQDLIQMLYTRVSSDGRLKSYGLTAACNHDFIYNSDRHINDGQPKINTLEDMHRIMKEMFRNYPYESWEYMHVRGLNAYFGSEECAYGLLNLVTKLTDTSDKKFRFRPLLQALNMCCIMLAKFHNLHLRQRPTNTPFLKEIKVAAIEIETCIKGLQSSREKMHNCLLIRFDDYQLKDVDKLVFRSVRIILYALHFLCVLIGGKTSTGSCITNAYLRTSTSLSKFSKSAEIMMMQLPRRRTIVINSSKYLPSVNDVRKIAGLSFIITEGARSSLSDKIEREVKKLGEMMKEDPACVD